MSTSALALTPFPSTSRTQSSNENRRHTISVNVIELHERGRLVIAHVDAEVAQRLVCRMALHGVTWSQRAPHTCTNSGMFSFPLRSVSNRMNTASMDCIFCGNAIQALHASSKPHCTYMNSLLREGCLNPLRHTYALMGKFECANEHHHTKHAPA